MVILFYLTNEEELSCWSLQFQQFLLFIVALAPFPFSVLVSPFSEPHRGTNKLEKWYKSVLLVRGSVQMLNFLAWSKVILKRIYPAFTATDCFFFFFFLTSRPVWWSTLLLCSLELFPACQGLWALPLGYPAPAWAPVLFQPPSEDMRRVKGGWALIHQSRSPLCKVHTKWVWVWHFLYCCLFIFTSICSESS